jgi:hypothetical protein
VEPSPGSSRAPASGGSLAAAALLVLLPILAVYRQAAAFPFIAVDDPLYVAANPRVLGGLTAGNVAWAFTTFHAGNWHPVTWLSHQLDATLFGPDPSWHHRVNVAIHVLNAELLLLVLRRATGSLWRSALVAVLFGVHPLHVEAVAWVAERKELLAGLFWMLALGAYVGWVRRPSAARFAAVLLFHALGLMSKPMGVTLPFALLLVDRWPLGRMESLRDLPRLAAGKAPLFLLSAASCAITVAAQRSVDAVRPLDLYPFGTRCLNAVLAGFDYAAAAAWPAGLSIFYPHAAADGLPFPAWRIGVATVFLAAATATAVLQARRRPWLPVGWFWFLGTLVPVIGLVQVGGQAHADRYTYIPLVGLFVAAAWGTAELARDARGRNILAAGWVAAALALTWAGWRQAGWWRDGVTLFSRAVSVTEGNWFAWNALGWEHGRAGRPARAADCFREAVRIAPRFAEAWTGLGVALAESGDPAGAVDALKRAVALDPESARAWTFLGRAYEATGRTAEARASLDEAARLGTRREPD